MGINVCKAFLQAGFQARVFDLATPNNRKSVKRLAANAEIQWGDITQPDSVRKALEGVDAVVHMAGVLPPVADEKPELAIKVNVGGTKILVELLKQKAAQIPLIFTSSVAVFGPTPDATKPLCPEKHLPNPKGTYGETKLQAEDIIRESGIDYVILRLAATMYLSFTIRDLKRMFTIPLNNRVEYCHPDDAALAILNAVNNFEKVKGHTLVISGGPKQRMLYKDMIGTILRVMGLPLPPARKFTTEPFYLDCYDTAKSQKLLKFQHRTFTDYVEDFSKELSRRFGPGFIPFMRHFVGPIFGKIIVQFF